MRHFIWVFSVCQSTCLGVSGPVRLPIYNFLGAFIKRDFFFAICKPLFFFIHLKKKIVFYSMKIDLVLAKSALFGISSGFIMFAKVSI